MSMRTLKRHCPEIKTFHIPKILLADHYYIGTVAVKTEASLTPASDFSYSTPTMSTTTISSGDLMKTFCRNLKIASFLVNTLEVATFGLVGRKLQKGRVNQCQLRGTAQ